MPGGKVETSKWIMNVLCCNWAPLLRSNSGLASVPNDIVNCTFSEEFKT